jgi:hypothetical protein
MVCNGREQITGGNTMKLRVKETGEVIGEVITNHNMTIYEACELAGIDTDEYDPEDLSMDYDDND